MQNWAICPQTRFLDVIEGQICAKLESVFPFLHSQCAKLFLHSLSPHFERNDQLLRKRISFDYIKPELLPVRLQKLKYGPSCISAKHLYGPCPHFHHGWRAFEGFDFVGEAEDVVVGRFSPLQSGSAGNPSSFQCQSKTRTDNCAKYVRP